MLNKLFDTTQKSTQIKCKACKKKTQQDTSDRRYPDGIAVKYVLHTHFQGGERGDGGLRALLLLIVQRDVASNCVICKADVYEKTQGNRIKFSCLDVLFLFNVLKPHVFIWAIKFLRNTKSNDIFIRSTEFITLCYDTNSEIQFTLIVFMKSDMLT